MPGTLFIVATPIGNLGDITIRAIETLKSVDLILCEDTRETKKLLEHYEITTPTESYHEHSEFKKVNYIIELLGQGKNLALVSDAGTPGISDPGGKLIEYVRCRTPHIGIVPIPGPSALTAAASVSGFNTSKFLFLGFPPVKNKRKKFFEEIVNSKYPVIFYESPHRILKTLRLLRSARNDDKRNIVVCRELTKKFESVYRGTPDQVIAELEKDTIKGEFVVIVQSPNF